MVKQAVGMACSRQAEMMKCRAGLFSVLTFQTRLRKARSGGRFSVAFRIGIDMSFVGPSSIVTHPGEEWFSRMRSSPPETKLPIFPTWETFWNSWRLTNELDLLRKQLLLLLSKNNLLTPPT